MLPVGLVAAIAGLELILPADRSALPLLVAVPTLPLVGAVNPARCLRLGALSLAVAAVLGLPDLDRRPVAVSTTLLGIVIVTAIATAAARSFVSQARALSELRAVADSVQRAVLHPLPLRLGPLRMAARYLAAAPQALLGGDFYAAVSTGFGTRLVIGDACGHGMPAVRIAADALAAFRDLAHVEPSLAGLPALLHAALAQHDQGRLFVTALFVEIPPAGRTANVVCCGHPPPLLIRDGQPHQVDLQPVSLPIGLLHLDDAPCGAQQINLAPGDRLLLYTDGVIEARDGQDRFYPLLERAGALHDDDPDSFLDAVRSDLLDHTDGQLRDIDGAPHPLGTGRHAGRLHDDAVLLLVQFDGEQGGADADPGARSISLGGLG